MQLAFLKVFEPLLHHFLVLQPVKLKDLKLVTCTNKFCLILNNIDLLKLLEEVAVSGVVWRNITLMSNALFQIEFDVMGVKLKGSTFHTEGQAKPLTIHLSLSCCFLLTKLYFIFISKLLHIQLKFSILDKYYTLNFSHVSITQQLNNLTNTITKQNLRVEIIPH